MENVRAITWNARSRLLRRPDMPIPFGYAEAPGTGGNHKPFIEEGLAIKPAEAIQGPHGVLTNVVKLKR